MSFLNPAALWGLLALAVPIIIHFFNLQRPRQVLFSNVAFVKEVKKTVVRRLRFRQWLLLIARLLAIALLVLAFANPVIVEDENRLARLGNRSVAVVIDDSYSMIAGNERGDYWQQAKRLSREIINAYGAQNEFLVTTTSDLALNANFDEAAAALDDLQQLEIRQSLHPHTEILGFLDQIFSSASNGVRELYFIGDFQRSTVLADSQRIALSDSSVDVKYIPLATRPQKNVYVRNQRIVSQIVEAGKPIEMQLTLVNDGEQPVTDLGVRVLLDDRVEAIATETLDAGETREVTLSFTPKSSGWLGGYIELDDLPIDFDNRRYFTLYVPAAERVLVAEGTRSESVRILYQDLFTQFDTDFVDFRQLTGEDLSPYRSLVIVGGGRFSSGLNDRLRDFLNNGGSIMLLPGEDFEVEGANQLFQSLGVGRFGEIETAQPGLVASDVELDHPIFDGVFSSERRSREFDAPVVFRYYPFTLGNGAINDVILRMGNRAPLVVQSRPENGLIFLFTTFPGNTFTNFHLKTAFAPIMYRATQIMNQTQNVQLSQEIGAYTPVSVRTSSPDLIRLEGENDETYIPVQYPRGGATVLNFDQLDISEGNYRVVQGETDPELLQYIAFNASDAESRLEYADQIGLRQNLAASAYGSIRVLEPDTEGVREEIAIEQEGNPLWKFFIIGALLFLLFEILLLKFKK